MKSKSHRPVAAEPSERQPRARPGRQRLLGTADELFYRDGLMSAGIDRIIERAGVAKGTLYANFRTKDELIHAYLEERHVRTIKILEEIAASSGSVSEFVDGLFDYLTELSDEEAFRGCAFVVAAAEMPKASQPAMEWASLHKRAVSRCFKDLFVMLGVREPGALADQLTILYDGALITSVLRPESDALQLAREMAHLLTDDRESSPRTQN